VNPSHQEHPLRQLLAALFLLTTTSCFGTIDGAPARSFGLGDAVRSVVDPHWSSLEPLDSLQIALLYSQVSGTAIPWNEYAYFYDEVRSVQYDEFRLRDAIVRAGPWIQAARERVANAPGYVIRIRDFFREPYDFAKGGFVSPLRRGSTVPKPSPRSLTEPGFSVAFTNLEEFEFLPMSQGAGRRLLDASSIRQVVFELEVEPVSASSDSHRRILTMYIRRFRLLTERGEPLIHGVSEAPKPSAEAPSSPSAPAVRR
jgi:hypothetical protein